MISANVLEAFCETCKETNTETAGPEPFTSGAAPLVRQNAGLIDLVNFMLLAQMANHKIPSLASEVARTVGLRVFIHHSKGVL